MTEIRDAVRDWLARELDPIFEKIPGEVNVAEDHPTTVLVWLHPEPAQAGFSWSLCFEIGIVDGVPVPAPCEFFLAKEGEDDVEALSELPHVSRPRVPDGIKAIASEMEGRLELLDLPKVAMLGQPVSMSDLLRRAILAHAAGDRGDIDGVMAEATEFLVRYDRSLREEIDAVRSAPVFH